MGDEADADWQAGLVEWGIEDGRRAMKEGDFKRLYQGEFPPLVEDVYRAHGILAEKLHNGSGRPLTGCTSYIQRKMQCGYNHAAAIMQLMEEKGWITPADNKGARMLRPLHRS